MGGRCIRFLLLVIALIGCTQAYPSPLERYRSFSNHDVVSPGAHQLASWIASQLRRSELAASLEEVPVIPYRLPVQGKRNSEVTNAIIGSEETQKMYRDGRK